MRESNWGFATRCSSTARCKRQTRWRDASSMRSSANRGSSWPPRVRHRFSPIPQRNRSSLRVAQPLTETKPLRREMIPGMRRTTLRGNLAPPPAKARRIHRARPRNPSPSSAVERVALRQTLEVGAGHIVEQEVVLKREEFTEAPAQMLLERLLMRQQPIQRAVETIIVNPLDRQAQ